MQIDGTINLYDLTKDGAIRNLSGKEKGIAAREHFNLDELDDINQLIVVNIPETLDAISSSFFLGMFSQSVVKLGSKEEFINKFKFNGSATLLRQINKGISRSLAPRGPMRP